MPESFEQQPREGAKAFAAFSVYLSLGPERSLAAVGRKLGKSVRLMERWSRRFDWSSRVQAHAAHLAVVEREATEALTRTKAAQWLTRREEHKEDEWGLRSELITASRKVLKRFTEEGRGATLGDVARALDLASKLGRLATGLATDRTEVTGEGAAPSKSISKWRCGKSTGSPWPLTWWTWRSNRWGRKKTWLPWAHLLTDTITDFH